MRLPATKTLSLTAAAVLLAAALVVALRPRPIGVDLATIRSGPMQVLVEEEGRTRVRQVYTVSAPVAGRLLRPVLDAGDAVVRDQTTVAVIQPADPPFLDLRSRHEIEAQVQAGAATVDLAGAELRQAEAELVFAVSELDRAERLARTSTIAERALQKARLEVDTRKAAVARAKAQLELRRRELESARARLIGPETPPDHAEPEKLCCITLRSPASGRILRRLVDSERVVTSGTPLLEIGDTRDSEIIVDLLSTDAVKVVAGAPVVITGWGGGTTLSGTVRRIEPGGFTKVSALGIEEQRVRAIVDIVPAAGTDALGHDFRVFVGIVTWRSERVAQVPLSALFRKGGTWAVYLVHNGRARLATVEIGYRNAEVAELLSGLPEGSTIVLHPGDRIAEGTRIAPRSE